MTVAELRDVLRSRPVPDDAYVIDAEPKNEAYILADEGRTWSVYYAERGLRTQERTCATEDEACTELLRRLGRDFGFEG